MADVRLVDLAVIKRYSLAVRQEWAEAEEVLAILDASRQLVLAAIDEDAPPGDAGSRPRRARTRDDG